MREVGIVGIGHTKFGKTDRDFLSLLGEAALLCLDDAGVAPGPERRGQSLPAPRSATGTRASGPTAAIRSAMAAS